MSHQAKSASGERREKFNPIENMHLWVMWRTAVNEKIIRETRKKKNQDDRDHLSKVFTRVPLSKYIRLRSPSRGDVPYSGPLRERQWYNEDGFQTRQLVYFGLPRPKVNSTVALLPDY